MAATTGELEDPPPAGTDPPRDAVRAVGLSKTYGRHSVLEGVQFEVPRGRAAALVGPNGAGKTTTLRILLGLIASSSGQGFLLGRPVIFGRDDHLRGVGGTIEAPGFFRHLTGRENLTAIARMSREPISSNDINDALARVGLTDRADERVSTFSQGMKQRLALGAALLNGKELLMLDEPTNGLDPGGVREILSALKELRDGGSTLLLSTHLLADATDWCDYAIVIDHGRVVASGPLDDLPGVVAGTIIETASCEEAVRLLTSLGAAALIRDHGVLVMGEPDIPRLVSALAAAGVEIRSIERSRPSLVDIYDAATHGRAGD